MSEEISKEEFEQYDRQIRLWGLEAQKRLRQSNALVVGIGGLGSEIVKNIVLSGIHSITIMDHRLVTDEILRSQLLVTPNHIGQNIALASLERVQELNPNVIVKIASGKVENMDSDFFCQFEVVCLTQSSIATRIKIDAMCSNIGVKFLCGDVFGFFGFGFINLGKHEYAEEVALKSSGENKQGTDAETVTRKKVMEFCSYADALKEDWSKRNKRSFRNSSVVYFISVILDEFQKKMKRLPQHDIEDHKLLLEFKNSVLEKHKMKSEFVDDDFVNFCVSTLSPVAAIVGGVMSQEVIKAISKKDEPNRNFFFFDGLKHLGVVDYLSPK